MSKKYLTRFATRKFKNKEENNSSNQYPSRNKLTRKKGENIDRCMYDRVTGRVKGDTDLQFTWSERRVKMLTELVVN